MAPSDAAVFEKRGAILVLPAVHYIHLFAEVEDDGIIMMAR